MKSLAALVLSLALAGAAAPTLAQPAQEHGQNHGGGGGERRGGEERRGGYGEPRGGYGESRGGYGGPRGGYGDPRSDPRGGYPATRGGYPGGRGDYEPRGGYAEPRGGNGFAGPAPERRDSLGADWGGQQDEVRAGVRQGRYVGLARVIGSIRQRAPGRQLDAGLEQWGGRAVYRVRWAEPGGRRTDYIVDAQSGAILHVDGR